MQTETTVSETTVAETAVPEETTEPIPKEIESVIEAPKEEPTAPPVVERLEQMPAPETTTETIVEEPVEAVKTETTSEPTVTPKTPAETVEKEETTKIPKPSKHRLRMSQSRRKRSLMSTTGSALQGHMRFKSGLKSTRWRWIAGITRRPPTPTAFILSET